MIAEIEATISMMIMISVTKNFIHIYNSVYNFNYYNYIESFKIVKLQVL